MDKDFDIDLDFEDVELPVSNRTLGITAVAVTVFAVFVTVLVVAPSLWQVAIIATLIGFIPGVLLFPWFTSPFGPGLWLLSEPFARIHFTISQVIRRAGVLVKRASNEYELGTYLPDSGEVLVSDTRVAIDEDRTRWGLFGKRKLGVTWELGTDFFQRVTTADARADTEGVADGGEIEINLDAAHRFTEGVNEADAITRTEEQAEAKYGGGGDELSGTIMAVLVGFMLLMGSLMTMLML